ncbi:flagellar hook-length control protein FliK [Marinobacter sp. LN3S78]|uniref:flagellar hook-length control protein FliK n=1 Tax=Marinobacter sp. LN3S78 TaxID=3382300 RepID=UPI00387B008F
MKLPDGNPINTQPPKPPAGNAGTGQPDPLRQLQSLQLENRQAVVARVAELLSQRGMDQAILEVRGQKLTVNLPGDRPELKVGDLLRLMREGSSLTLLDKLPATAETRLGQALIRHLPWQQHLDSGLSQLLATLSAGLRAAPGTSTQPGASQPVPTTVREALQAIARLLPRASTETTGLTFRPLPATSSISQAPLAPLTSLASPGTPGLDAEGVKQWLINSGVMTEARLARGTLDAAPTDLKLALGRLALTLLQHQNLGSDQFTRFTPLPSHELVTSPLQFPAPTTTTLATGDSREPASPGQMLRLLAGMLNRITVNQLHSQLLTTRSGAEGAPQINTLVTDLPWMAPGGEVKTAQLRIDYNQPEQQEKQGSRRAGVAEWRLNLAMDLDEAGKVFFDIALRQQALSARVWAERQATARQVNQELGDLRTRLTDLGLEVTELECRRGQPPAAATRLEHRLLDTRA